MGFKIDTWAPHIYYDISEAKCLQRKLLPLTGSPFFSASSFLKAIPFALNEFFFFLHQTPYHFAATFCPE